MGRYHTFTEGSRVYFITSTIVEWTYVFTEQKYFETIVASLRYCQENKGLDLIGYVIMLNHIHWISHTDSNTQLSDVMRDFKRFTSRQLSKLLKEDNKRLPLYIFRKAAAGRRDNPEFKVWQEGFHPQQIFSMEMLRQKLTYMHNNPVRKGFVERPEHWFYSSARNYILQDHSTIKIDIDRWY
jgi:REP element-mobilizing transposase RayT